MNDLLTPAEKKKIISNVHSAIDKYIEEIQKRQEWRNNGR